MAGAYLEATLALWLLLSAGLTAPCCLIAKQRKEEDVCVNLAFREIIEHRTLRPGVEVTVRGAAGRVGPPVRADVGGYVLSLAGGGHGGGGGGGGSQQRGPVVDEGLPAVLSGVDHVVRRLPLEEAEPGGGREGCRPDVEMGGLLM